MTHQCNRRIFNTTLVLALAGVGGRAHAVRKSQRGRSSSLLQPHLGIARLPTPVERAISLGDAIQLPRLYLKRDDLSHPRYGGGKVRKLEFLLAEARARGVDTIVTFGGVGSNHAAATALLATPLGFKVKLYLLPQPPSPAVRATLVACHGAGAEMHLGWRGVERAPASRLSKSPAFIIPWGGSSAIGNMGFVRAAFELQNQVAAGEIPEPDRIYLAMGTMGSAVGLALGLQALKMKTRVIAVRASSHGTSSSANLRKMVQTTARLLQRAVASPLSSRLDASNLKIVANQLGRGYAIPTNSGRRAQRIVQEHTSLRLDPTYTSKAFAALVADAPKSRDEVVLFWHSMTSHVARPGLVDPHELPPAFRGYFLKS